MTTGWIWGVACTWVTAAGIVSAVPVTDFAVYAGGNVGVQDGVVGDVGSQTGSVQVKGKNVDVQGDVSAGGAVQVSSGAAVDGAVNSGAAITKTGKGVVTGLASASLSGGDLASVLAGGLLPAHSFTAGGTSYTGTQKSLSLNPGSYGSVGGKKAGTLYLQSGSYYFSGLSGKGDRIMLDLSQGPINLYVTGNFNLSKSSVFVKNGSGNYVSYGSAERDLAGLVYAEVDGSATLSSSQWFGTLFTPKGALLASNASVTGALYSGTSIQLKGKGQTILYAPLAGPSVPASGGQAAGSTGGQSGDAGAGTGDQSGAGAGSGDPGDVGQGTGDLGDVALNSDPGGPFTTLAAGLTPADSDGLDPADGETGSAPEPTTLALLCSGLLAVAARRRRQDASSV